MNGFYLQLMAISMGKIMINHDKLHQLWWFSWVTSVIYHDIPSSSFRLVETLGLLLEITFVTTLVVYFFIFIGLKWADSPFVAHLSLGISDSGLGAPLQFSNAFRNHGTFRNGRKNWIELDRIGSFIFFPHATDSQLGESLRMNGVSQTMVNNNGTF